MLHVVVNDVVSASLYPGYDPLSQAVSELSATGSPAKAFLTAFSPIWTVLWIAFGIGVTRAAGGRRALRATGALVVAHGIVALLWLLFPMTSRAQISPGAPPAVNDVGHLGMTAATIASVLSQLGLLRRGVRVAVPPLRNCQRPDRHRVRCPDRRARCETAGREPTPWMGLFERSSIAPWLLWMAVLAVILLKRRGESQEPERVHNANTPATPR